MLLSELFGMPLLSAFVVSHVEVCGVYLGYLGLLIGWLLPCGLQLHGFMMLLKFVCT